MSAIKSMSATGSISIKSFLINSPLFMSPIKVTKTEGAEESVELLASSIVQVAEGFQKIERSGLNRRGLVALLREGIGHTKITNQQINLVLDSLARLKAWYVK